MKEFNSADLITILVILIICGGAFVLINQDQRRPAYSMKCTNNLKQVGLGMQMYFMDGSETHMPLDKGTLKVGNPQGWHALFELEPIVLWPTACGSYEG